ncbi:HAD family hydrolase [Pseudoxanthomonas kalamensis DSM 18571]|uniref:HAD family hydrolase n=1 Tax=Pseudoxanthomonas kalamensis TaxID=289483 RepID=UPI001390DBE9|nr:HAD-IA family hydrolase [Pseudoxanthomonas kalamensis]KAF1711493.1 HAD family hydrolase [Pseudoxanthomonas kalamensis DSM 18571]
MSFTVRAITLDLDDTLWPFAPVGARIERVLDDWLREHSPATASMFPVERMRELRERVFAQNCHLLHDLSALRRLTLEVALRDSGADLDLLDAAYETFYAARNQVELYPDSLDALQRISARFPLASLSNGNADLERIGLAGHFVAQLHSREHGAAKPEASIFHAACQRLGVAPGEVLHVGDHADLDAAGAIRAGLRSCWLNREGHDWPHDDIEPDLQFDTLTALADWLDATQPDTDPRVHA